MRIHVKFRGLPQLYRVMNKQKDVDLELPGNTVRDCVDRLIGKYGAPMKKALLDQNGDVDMEVRVVLNERTFLQYHGRMDIPLNDGDSLQFMSVG